MKCKKCGIEMNLTEGDFDNPYCRCASYSCECGTNADLTWWGSSDEPEINWED